MLFGYKILVYCTSQVSKTSFTEFISTLNDELVNHNWRVMVFCTESDLGKEIKNKKGEVVGKSYATRKEKTKRRRKIRPLC